MGPALILSHAAIAVVALLSVGAAVPQRSRFVQGLAVAGGTSSILLFFAAPFLDESWRTLELTASRSRIVAVAITCAWVLVAVAERSRGGGRWDVVATTGVASTALCLFALNSWTVPALIFGAIAALATVMSAQRWGVVEALVAVGFALLAATLVWTIFDTETWRLPVPLSVPRLWLAVGAIASFATGAILSESDDRPSPSTPLILGLAFVVLASTAQASGPLVALAFIAIALLAVIRTLTRETVGQRVVLVWVVALSVGLAALSADAYVATRSAIAGLLAATAIRLWPLSLGRAQIERGILVAFVAMTAGFNAIAAAANYSFDRSISLERVLEAAPWAGISALLPIALAGGVVLGASIGSNPEPEDYSRSGVLASWCLVILTVIVGVFPYVGPNQEAGMAGPGLYVVALIAGIAGARYLRLSHPSALPREDSRFLDVPLRLVWPRSVAFATRVLAGVTGLVVVAVTFQGLRVGFL